MKKLLTLLFLSMAYMGGVLAQITLDGSETIMTQDELRATVTDGSHFGITAVSNTNDATNHKFYNGSGSMSNELTKNYLCTLELKSGTENQYYLKSGDGKYFKTGTSGQDISKTESVSEAQAFTINTGTSNDATENYSDQEANWIRFTCAGQNYWLNCQTGLGKYNQGPGGWTAFGIIGPFHLCTLNITKDGETTTLTDQVVERGSYTNIPDGYELETPVNIDQDGTYDINFRKTGVTFTYSYKYNEVEKYTENVSAIPGANFPSPATTAATAAMPFGIAIGAAPAGEVSAEDEGTTKVIELTSTLPFEFYSTYGEIAKWYALQGNSNTNDHRWVYSNNGALALTSTMSRETLNASEQISDYSWAFIGDPFTGFQIVNKGATEANGGTPRMISDANPCAFTSEPNIVHFGQGDPNDADHFSIYKNGTGNGKYYNVRSDGTIQRWSLDKGCTFKAIEFTPKDPIAFALLNRQGVGTHSSLDGKTVGTFSAAYNVALPSGVEAYVASRVGDVLYFESIGDVVPANEGVLLYIENSTENYNGVASYTDESVPTVVSNALQPLLNNAPIEAGDYVLTNAYNGVGFYPRETATTASNKAYIPAEVGAGIRGFVFAGEGDITTAISQLSAAQSQTSAYDLAGRRVSAAVKGISIVNGKKLIK